MRKQKTKKKKKHEKKDGVSKYRKNQIHDFFFDSPLATSTDQPTDRHSSAVVNFFSVDGLKTISLAKR